MVPLGDLPGGDVDSTARAASFDGSVIVGSGTTATGTEAFRWTSATGIVGLGQLPGGGASGIARDVNADGSVIVGSAAGATLPEAFYWTPAGMTRLWDVLLLNGINPADTGWSELYDATGVSADGLTVTGTGVRNGNVEGFVAVVPEPASLALLAFAAVACTRRSRPCAAPR